MTETMQEIETTEAMASETPEPDDGDVTEPEPEDEPAPEDDPDEPEAQRQQIPSTGAAADSFFKELESAGKAYGKRVAKAMEEETFGFAPCPLCNDPFPGVRIPRLPSEEAILVIREVIGLPALENFAPSATERVCDDCRGLGKVRTGSSVQGRESATCDACAGYGYVSSRPRQNTGTPAAEPEPAANGAAVVHDDGIRRDMFGTPEGDPDFEKLPNARVRPVDYWASHRA